MATTVTVKGQVTIPKEVRDAVGIRPGDSVEVRATASGGVYIEKAGAKDDYHARLMKVAKMGVIQGATTDEIMEMTRGEIETEPVK